MSNNWELDTNYFLIRNDSQRNSAWFNAYFLPLKRTNIMTQFRDSRMPGGGCQPRPACDTRLIILIILQNLCTSTVWNPHWKFHSNYLEGLCHMKWSTVGKSVIIPAVGDFWTRLYPEYDDDNMLKRHFIIYGIYVMVRKMLTLRIFRRRIECHLQSQV